MSTLTITLPFIGTLSTEKVQPHPHFVMDLSEGDNERNWSLYHLWLMMTGPVIYRDQAGAHHVAKGCVFTHHSHGFLEIDLIDPAEDELIPQNLEFIRADDLFASKAVQYQAEQDCCRFYFYPERSSDYHKRIYVSKCRINNPQKIREHNHIAEMYTHWRFPVSIHHSAMADAVHAYELDPVTCVSPLGQYTVGVDQASLVLNMADILVSIAHGATSGTVCYLRGLKHLTQEQEVNHEIRDRSDYYKRQILSALIDHPKHSAAIQSWFVFEINEENFLTWTLES